MFGVRTGGAHACVCTGARVRACTCQGRACVCIHMHMRACVCVCTCQGCACVGVCACVPGKCLCAQECARARVRVHMHVCAQTPCVSPPQRDRGTERGVPVSPWGAAVPTGPGAGDASLGLCQARRGASSLHMDPGWMQMEKGLAPALRRNQGRWGPRSHPPDPPSLSPSVGPEGAAGSRCPGTSPFPATRAPTRVAIVM